MERYITIQEMSTGEYCEKHSRFIAVALPCQTGEEASVLIDRQRTKMWDANHHVYAYITDNGKTVRFSDDGEPHGTAGKPVLEALQGSGLVNVCVVVTRYFGGVLLGTGGLVRAYTKACQQALATANCVEYLPCDIIRIQYPYSEHSKLQKLLESFTVVDVKYDYGVAITARFGILAEQKEKFLSDLQERFSAQLTAEEIETVMHPFPVECLDTHFA